MASNPLKWHGGKHYLAKPIVELMPPHLHFVVPFFGGGAVLFARDPNRDWYEGAPDYDGSASMRGCSEVVNDIDRRLTRFWEVLQDARLFRAFKRIVEATPFSEELYERLNRLGEGVTPVDDALRVFIRYRQSRQGLGKDFATLSRTRTRRRMSEQASAWLSAVEGLPEAHNRLKRVVILNHDALDVIREQDGPRTHFYCDPTYLPETRTAKDCYEHEMTRTQHVDLLKTLERIQGTFQLSGYHSDLYDTVTNADGWRCVEFNLPNNASGKKKKERKVECLWMNYR